MVELIKNKLTPNIQATILSQISQFIKDEDFYLAQLSIDLVIKIVSINPTSTPELETAINNSITLSKSSLIQGVTINKLIDLFSLIAQKGFPTENLIQKLIQNINKNSMIPASKSIAALVLHSNQQVSAKFIELFKNDVIIMNFLIFDSCHFNILDFTKKSN